MSAQYKPVIWNRNKLIYDALLITVVAIYVLTFVRLVPMFCRPERRLTIPTGG